MSNKNNQEFPEYMDYHAMRKAGLEYVQKLSGKIWTDYNLHDPGVTILELLCYALADLGFRTSFKMPDLLTQSDKTASEASLIPPHEILSSAPITVEDYRKLILENVPGVKNVHFRKSDASIIYADRKINLHGRYDVLVELDKELSTDAEYANRCREIVARNANGKFDKSDIDIKLYYKSYIKNLLAKHRNLCEDFTSVEFVTNIPVCICSHIEVQPYSDLNKILREFYQKLEEYVSPSIKHYSLQEMIEKGKTFDEIFQGSNPKYGFIDRDELKTHQRKKVLYNSDVINILMSIDGVVSVPHFQFMDLGDEYKQNVSKSEYNISLNDNDSTAWSFSDFDNNRIIWEINGIDFPSKEMITLSKKEVVKQNNIMPKKPEGRYRNTDVYYSIQNFFPKNYKLGTEGISSLESDSRKAERMQLKAYIMFFDQLMGDYLMQLSSFSKIFSHKNYEDARTYFTKILTNKEIVDIESLLNYKRESENTVDYICDGGKTYSDTVDGNATKRDRYSRVLDHLLARFNEKFVDYSFFKLKENNNLSMADNQINSINDKVYFLDNYPKLSANRSLGLDYTENWNLTSLERLILSKLGIDRLKGQANRLATAESKKASATYDKYFGLHIIEHPLLSLIYNGGKNVVENHSRFLDLSSDNKNGAKTRDFYSMQVTVVVPGWLKICEDRTFRDIVEKTIRQEIPAHISAKICWISHEMMAKIETTYENYLSSIKMLPYSDIAQSDTKAISEALSEMVGAMYALYNIYPIIKLVNPNANSASNGECIRLGFSALPNKERKIETIEETIEIPISFEFIAGGIEKYTDDIFISKVSQDNPHKGDGEMNIFESNKVTVDITANMGIDPNDNNTAVFEIAYKIKESAKKGAVANNADTLSFFASQKLSINKYWVNKTKTKKNNGRTFEIAETTESIEIICEQTKFSSTFPMNRKNNFNWKQMSGNSNENECIPDAHSWIKADSLFVKIDGNGSELTNENLGVKGTAICILKVRRQVVTEEIFN